MLRILAKEKGLQYSAGDTSGDDWWDFATFSVPEARADQIGTTLDAIKQMVSTNVIEYITNLLDTRLDRTSEERG